MATKVERKSNIGALKKKLQSTRRMPLTSAQYSALPPAFVEGKFTAQPGCFVYVWRMRSGSKPSWYKCKVIRASDDVVELWDEDAGQWFCFDPSDPVVPDVRIIA